ncbi:MAG: hypothetical protein WCI53_01005 [Bacteroidota bacterium]
MLKFKYIKTATIAITTLSLCLNVQARQNVGKGNIVLKTGNNIPTVSNPLSKMGAGCLPATAQKELSVNNVRTIILNGGDMWWNLSNARYEIPKVQTGQVAKNSLFSGALWIGGITQGNLRLAAQTYRQNGNDFYPGPLQIDGSASITAARCKEFDRIYSVTRSQIALQIADQYGEAIPTDITDWPGNGKTGEAKYLAPFFDVDNDGIYDASAGDYPTFNDGEAGINSIPDQMMFVCYNDKGNIHTETQGLPLNLEFRLQAFGFATNDEVNNMTFYKTTIINRGTEIIDSCIFGQWVDPDLGNYTDDYVECDVPRNLGICYNGDDNDEGVLGYGLNPPSVGVNFFEGPLNENGIQIGLSKFVYYDNNQSQQGNPSNPAHFWNYLNGRWKDGQNITYGGNGRGGSDTASYMFPGSTDPAKRTAWTERIAGNTPADRRFLQTAGPFKLLPGAVNRVTIGVVWARATTGGATGSFNLLKEASDKATVLFKNNFKILRGPEFEDNAVKVTELNRELIINLVNVEKPEAFKAKVAGLCIDSTDYKFQGYQIYQLKIPSTPSDFSDRDQARLVAQCDIQDGIGFIVNTVNDADLGSVKRVMVNGEDKGIRHSFQITRDAFSIESDQTLVNYKNYHFLIVPYAAVTNCANEALQYLSGSKPVIVSVTPHLPFGHQQGTQLNSGFNSGPSLTRIEGIGNGGNFINLTKESIEEALSSPYYAKKPKYIEGQGPVGIKVINPFKVPLANFVLFIKDAVSSTRLNDSLARASTTWYMINKNTNDTFVGKRNLVLSNEQIFEEIGLSVTVSQAYAPGDPQNTTDLSNGFIDATITFEDPTNRWLSGVADGSISLPAFNWIRSGNTGTPEFTNLTEHDFFRSIGGNKVAIDPRKQYSNMLEATWAPFELAAKSVRSGSTPPSYGPGISLTPNTNQISEDNPLSSLQGVDVVFTSDKSKWTRCIVLEMGENKDLNIGSVSKGNIRASASIDKDGKPEAGSFGLSWFPGYAINVETGERLNIVFGEDSSLPGENGNDMIWNPTRNLFDLNSNGAIPAFGGKHHVYIMAAKDLKIGNNVLYRGVKYDEGKSYKELMAVNSSSEEPNTLKKRYFLSQFMWVTIPTLNFTSNLNSMKDGIVPNTATVKIRVKRPYAVYTTNIDTPLRNAGQPLYEFNTNSIAPSINDKTAGNKALDMVNVTPNPYYAYSGYEDPGNALDNRVKIVNTPKKCVVSIYTQSGFLVRRINKDDDTRTYIEWDLKNDANVPVSSGVYLIHINAPGIGERIIKWFGVIRPADFDSF